MAVFSIFWVAAILGLLYWWTPDAGYPNDPDEQFIYHIVWVILASMVITLHYKIMDAHGYGKLAIELDLGGLGIYLFGRSVLAYLRMPHQIIATVLYLVAACFVVGVLVDVL